MNEKWITITQMNGFHEFKRTTNKNTIIKKIYTKLMQKKNQHIQAKTKQTDGEIEFDVVVIAFEINVCKMSVIKVSKTNWNKLIGVAAMQHSVAHRQRHRDF